jgi:hypothetical protein
MKEDPSSAVQTENRRLAAIMFTDIVGFSRQMGADEACTMRLLAVHHRVIQQAVLPTLVGIGLGVYSEWMMFAGEDIAAQVRRKSDGKAFMLGLAELKAVEKKSPNYQVLDDYTVFFVNYR